MTTDQGSYKAFRARLDDVLRQRNPEALRAFLVAEGQWRPEDTTDTEAAMWMMIATSPALRAMHDEAQRWLLTHGHETEASAIFGGRRKPAPGARQPSTGARKPSASDRKQPTGGTRSRSHPSPERPKRTPPKRGS